MESDFSLLAISSKKKLIVKGDILLKLAIALCLPLIFFFPKIIFIIILCEGILNPFNTMSHLEMLRKEKDQIDTPQKDMVINLASYFAKMVSAYLLLNINQDIAIIIIILTLTLSTVLEYRLYKEAEK